MEQENKRTEYAHLADEEHDWSLSTAHSPNIVQTSNAVLHAQQQLSPPHSNTADKQ